MIDTQYIADLYRRYLKDLRSVRDQQRRFLRWNNNTASRKIAPHAAAPLSVEADVG